MSEKVTIMRLKVDLECPKCYKKVKKLLCKFPQIRDQVYDEKNNIVTIAVVCCNPEKLRDKLCCKGCGTIKSIEIVEPPKPPPPQKSKPPQTPVRSPPSEPVRPPQSEPVRHPPSEPVSPPPSEPVSPPPSEPVRSPPSEPVCPPSRPPMAVPIGVCCGPCYEGRAGGPCFGGYGGPPQCYDVYYGRPVYDSYGGGRPCYVSRCDEDNTSACTIM